MTNYKIGFIGQGWIGKNYADDFEERGFSVVRYSLEEQYVGNKDRIKDCDIVFVAVPTPTKKAVCDDGIVREALTLVGDGKISVIKSTLLPGTTKKIQESHPHISIVLNPEFLSVATARFDASHPTRNIIGLPSMSDESKVVAQKVLSVLPKAPFELICDSTEAEVIKYARNCIGYARVLMANVFYDLSLSLGANYDVVADAISADPDNGPTYARALHKSGRGAGGECFIKDFSAFSHLYSSITSDAKGIAMLEAMEAKNIELLSKSQKDIPLLKSVYGDIIG